MCVAYWISGFSFRRLVQVCVPHDRVNEWTRFGVNIWVHSRTGFLISFVAVKMTLKDTFSTVNKFEELVCFIMFLSS